MCGGAGAETTGRLMVEVGVWRGRGGAVTIGRLMVEFFGGGGAKYVNQVLLDILKMVIPTIYIFVS